MAVTARKARMVDPLPATVPWSMEAPHAKGVRQQSPNINSAEIHENMEVHVCNKAI